MQATDTRRHSSHNTAYPGAAMAHKGYTGQTDKAHVTRTTRTRAKTYTHTPMSTINTLHAITDFCIFPLSRKYEVQLNSVV